MMKFKASIVPLVFVFILIEGDINQDSRVTQTPQWQVDRSRNLVFYSCRFNFKVRCNWRVNRYPINIADHGYKWITGNGSNTNDCSIEAKSNSTQRFSDDRNRVECIGIGDGPRKVTMGDSIELQCPATNQDKCSWTRKDVEITMNWRLGYAQHLDCSIRIKNILPFDLTDWKCYESNSHQWSSAVYTLVELIPTEQTTVNTTSETVAITSETAITSTEPTIQSTTNDSILKSSDETNATTITTNAISAIEATATSVDQPKQTDSAVFVATIIVLSIVIIVIGIVWIYRTRIKKRNTTHGDDNRHNHHGNVSEVPSSTSNVHHSFGHVKATKCQRETEDDDGYLIACTQQSRSENAKPTNTKRLSDPKSHVYETIKDDIYTNVQH